MATFLLIIKLLALSSAIFWTSVNAARVYGKVDVPSGNFFWQAASTTVFVWLQWL
jgi:hypothetical protein